MKGTDRVVALAAAAEAITGLALIASPSIVTDLLFGGPALGIALVSSRIAGIALVALAIACWPSSGTRDQSGRYAGLLTYSVLAALVLGEVTVAGETTGPLLWPAVIVHAVLGSLIGFAWVSDRRAAIPQL